MRALHFCHEFVHSVASSSKFFFPASGVLKDGEIKAGPYLPAHFRSCKTPLWSLMTPASARPTTHLPRPYNLSCPKGGLAPQSIIQC